MNTDSLTALRGKKPEKPVWRPPTLDAFQQDRLVVAVDQSLSACGVVVLSCTTDGLSVLDCDTFRIPAFTDGRGGREHEVRRAMVLRDKFSPWLARIMTHHLLGIGSAHLVHEAIPEGNFLRNPEASMLAAMAIRIAAYDHNFPLLEPIHRYTHYQFTCGYPKATKKVHGATLMEVAAQLGILNRNLITNEGLRDALSIGLTALRKNDGE